MVIIDFRENEEDTVLPTAYNVYGTGMVNAHTDSHMLLNVTAVKKTLDNSHQIIQNVHFHFHVTKICAESLGFFELPTQSETHG